MLLLYTRILLLPIVVAVCNAVCDLLCYANSSQDWHQYGRSVVGTVSLSNSRLANATVPSAWSKSDKTAQLHIVFFGGIGHTSAYKSCTGHPQEMDSSKIPWSVCIRSSGVKQKNLNPNGSQWLRHFNLLRLEGDLHLLSHHASFIHCLAIEGLRHRMRDVCLIFLTSVLLEAELKHP